MPGAAEAAVPALLYKVLCCIWGEDLWGLSVNKTIFLLKPTYLLLSLILVDMGPPESGSDQAVKNICEGVESVHVQGRCLGDVFNSCYWVGAWPVLLKPWITQTIYQQPPWPTWTYYTSLHSFPSFFFLDSLTPIIPTHLLGSHIPIFP